MYVSLQRMAVFIKQWLLVLQTQDLKTNQEKESCIIVNIRELNGVFSTKLSSLYILD